MKGRAANVLPMPALGWCVRPGIRCSHFLTRGRGRHESVCGSVERLEEYRPQRLRPLQANKPSCLTCEATLRAMWKAASNG